MVAAGNTHGEITIFQIQKQLPNDLLPHEIAASLIASPIKPNERYTIRNIGRGRITCVEWSKNGLKLFSGDTNGVVLFTEFDFSKHICKSIEILNEKYGIVQMNFRNPWLLVSTLYRAIVCHRIETNEWKILQIGRSDRKILNEFGATFAPVVPNDGRKNNNNPTLPGIYNVCFLQMHYSNCNHDFYSAAVLCSRPRFRFWMADADGNVSHTFLLKDSVAKNTTIFEVPLLNPQHSKPVNIDDVYFGPCHYFLDKFIITYCESIVFIVNLELLKVIATIRRLRKIQYLTVNGSEIFIVEGGRSVVRIAMTPEPAINRNGIKYVQTDDTNLLANEMKIEIEEESITQGDECFELPPIENITLDVPLTCSITEHNLLRDDKLLLEHSRKMEVFEKLNELDYDDSILFEASTKRKKKISLDNTAVVDKFNGIVEIGQQAELIDKRQCKSKATNGTGDDLLLAPSNGLQIERVVRPSIMEASFCNGSGMLEAQTEEEKQCEIASEIQSHRMIGVVSGSTSHIAAIAFKPIEFNYPVNVNPITNATPIKANEDKSRAKQRFDAADNSQNIDKYPGLSNFPKLWNVSIDKCDESHDSAIGSDLYADEDGSSNEGIGNDWVFL